MLLLYRIKCKTQVLGLSLQNEEHKNVYEPWEILSRREFRLWEAMKPLSTGGCEASSFLFSSLEKNPSCHYVPFKRSSSI